MKKMKRGTANAKARGWRGRRLTMEEAELLRERWAATFFDDAIVARVPVYGRAGKIRRWEEHTLVSVRRKRSGAPLLKDLARSFGIDPSTASNIIAGRTYGGIW